jgi:hypothetical protein
MCPIWCHYIRKTFERGVVDGKAEFNHWIYGASFQGVESQVTDCTEVAVYVII